METEDIEDIYNLTRQVKQVQPFLRESTYRFEKYVDDFYQNEESSSNMESYFVSEGMIAHESAHFVDVIETHESLLNDLKEAVDQLPECQSNRYIGGERVRKDDLEEEIIELIDNYREDFNEVIRVYGKTAVEDLPGPQEVRSKRNEREARREAVSERSTTAALEIFFAD